jgi:2'-5' RNA ligase
MSEISHGQAPGHGAREPLRQIYDELWSGAVGRLRRGKPDLDPVLAAGRPDLRRGLTLMTRPTPEVRQRVAAFLRELRKLEPEQYYYSAWELHVTVLSLFTATVNHAPFFAKRTQYMVAVNAALRNAAPIRIDFHGVTASPGTVMIQGFVDDKALNGLRDALRQSLRAAGLGGGLDQRYRLRTAHMTVARFRHPLRDSERFGAVLEQARQRSFGSGAIRTVTLIENDWYMSQEASQVVKRYRLGGVDCHRPPTPAA